MAIEKHWRNPETGQVECEYCCSWALDYDALRTENAALNAQIASDTKRFSDRCIELERIIESRVDRAVVDALKEENADLKARLARMIQPVSRDEYALFFSWDEIDGSRLAEKPDVNALIEFRARASSNPPAQNDSAS